MARGGGPRCQRVDAAARSPPGGAGRRLAPGTRGPCPRGAGGARASRRSAMTATRQLVVCCPGEGLDALRAASAAGRPFDVWAAPDAARDPSRRFAALAALLRAEAAALERYEAVWLPDADVLFDPTAVERLFEEFRAHGLALAQPTLADGSPGAHAFAFASEVFALRLTRLVEPSAPVFSR